jgi:predicted GNAT family N-acyltransferase
VGCARLRTLGPGRGKVERVAVLLEERGSGLGRQLMQAVEAEAARRGLGDLLLHSQTAVVDFYARLGWRAFGDEFDEAGIPHYAMRRALS